MNVIDINPQTWTSIGEGSCLVASNATNELVQFKLGNTSLIKLYLGSQLLLENDGELLAKSTTRAIQLEVTEADADTRKNTADIAVAMEALQTNTTNDAVLAGQLNANSTADSALAVTVGELEGRISSLEEAPPSSGGGVAGMFLDDGREIKTKLIMGSASGQLILHGLNPSKILSVSMLVGHLNNSSLLFPTHSMNNNVGAVEFSYLINGDSIQILKGSIAQQYYNFNDLRILITYLA